MTHDWTQAQRDRLKQLKNHDARQFQSPDPNDETPVNVATCAEWRRRLANEDVSASELADVHRGETVRKHARGNCWHSVGEPAVVHTPVGWVVDD